MTPRHDKPKGSVPKPGMLPGPVAPSPAPGESGTQMETGATSAPAVDAALSVDLGLGGSTAEETPSRRYRPFPDFEKHPTKFIEAEDRPFSDQTLLRNGFFIMKEKYGNLKGRWFIYEPGAHPSGCAGVRGTEGTKREAILASLRMKPLEPLHEKRLRIEAEARSGAHSEAVYLVDGLLDDCRSMLGPITEDTRTRVRHYVADPTVENWEDIHGIIVAGRGSRATIWAQWIELDASAPRRGPAEDAEGLLHDEWDRIPTPSDVVVILNRAGRQAQGLKD